MIWAVWACLALLAGEAAGQQWRQVSAVPRPSPRRNAAAVYDPAGRRVVLFGGRGSSGDLNDVWAFDVAAERWEQVPIAAGSGATTAGPAPRFTHEAVYDPRGHRMLVWSGRKVDGDGTGLFNDVWALDLDTHRWTELDTGTLRPNLRYGTASVYDPVGHALVTYAGFTDEGRFHDTWRLDLGRLDLASATWRDISPGDGDPGRRCLHSAAYDATAGRMLIYGGQRTGALGDLWALDLGRLQWTELTPPERPRDRFFTALAHDVANRQLLIFGGDTGTEKLGDLWAYALGGDAWRPVHPAGTGPEPRDGAVAVYLPGAGSVLMWGGTGSGHLDDTWLLENLVPALPTAVRETRSGPPVSAHLGAFPNPFNGQVTLDYGVAGEAFATPARVEIWNLAGQRVWQMELPLSASAAGQVAWDGRDGAGRPAASGVYLARLTAGSAAQVTRLALVR